jgi:hypothetical protein
MSRKRNRLLLARPSLVAEYRRKIKSVWPIKPGSGKWKFRVWAPSVSIVICTYLKRPLRKSSAIMSNLIQICETVSKCINNKNTHIHIHVCVCVHVRKWFEFQLLKFQNNTFPSGDKVFKSWSRVKRKRNYDINVLVQKKKRRRSDKNGGKGAMNATEVIIVLKRRMQ